MAEMTLFRIWTESDDAPYVLLEALREELCARSDSHRETIEEHRDTLSTYKAGYFRGMSDAFGDAAQMVERLRERLEEKWIND